MRRKGLVWAFALLAAIALGGAPNPATAELKVGVSGYIKLDIQSSDKVLGGGFPSPGPADVPLDCSRSAPCADGRTSGTVDPAVDHKETILDARQSRLRATFSDEVAGVKMSGRIEADFFNGEGTALSSNSRNFRLRHAFVRGDLPSGFSVLAGQTWSLFMNDAIAQPDLVDFNGPAGQIFARQPQLRVGYRFPVMGGELVLEADIEKQSTPDLGAKSVNEAQGEGQDIPLFAGKVSWLGKAVQVEAGGAATRNRVILTSGKDETETAWGAHVSAQVDLEAFTGIPLTIFGHYQHVDGLNRLASGDFPTAFLNTTTSKIENVEANGLYGGATYRLTKNTSINAVYGRNRANRLSEGGFEGDALKRHQSVHFNVIHKFWERWQVGLEYRRFWVDAFSDRDGDVNIGHLALWYFF